MYKKVTGIFPVPRSGMHLLRSTFLFKSVPPAALAPIFRDMRGKQQDKWRGEKEIALSFLSYFPFSRQMNIFLFHPSSFFSFPRMWGRIAFFFFAAAALFLCSLVLFLFEEEKDLGNGKKGFLTHAVSRTVLCIITGFSVVHTSEHEQRRVPSVSLLARNEPPAD